jgi:hypothetical protein
LLFLRCLKLPFLLTHDGIGTLVFKRVTDVPGKDVGAVEGFASAFTVHPLHELANTFPLQKTVLKVAKKESWLGVRDTSFSPVTELVAKVELQQQQEAAHQAGGAQKALAHQ